MSLPKSVLLEVITPSKLFYKQKVEMVVVTTFTGEEGYMPGHTWACKLLDVGVLKIKEVGATEFKKAAISGGYVDVRDNIIIFTDHAEWAEDIDFDRALKEKENAQEWLTTHNEKNSSEDDLNKAKVSLAKQNVRMKIANNGTRLKI